MDIRLSGMGDEEPFRLRADFNYGGCFGDLGVVFLGPKRHENADRSGLRPHIRAQFQEAGIEPRDGLKILLVDPRADGNDDGVLCDMEVEGTLVWIEEDRCWGANYEWDAMTWIPSEP